MSLLALGAAALGAGASFLSAKQQQQAQMELQANNQQWQERMSNTAHQREVADLKKAGLNPVLSAGGQGATTPSGGVGEAQMADMGNAINTAISAKQAEAQIKNTEAQTENIKADTKNKEQLFEWTPDINKSIIDYQSANSAQARSNALVNVEKKIAYNLENKLQTMNVEKRREFFETEKELYEAQLKADLVEMGFEGDTAVKAVERAFETVGKVFGGSSVKSQSHSKIESHHSGSTTIKHEY